MVDSKDGGTHWGFRGFDAAAEALFPWCTLEGTLPLSPASAGTSPLRIWKKQWHNRYQQHSARGDFVAGGIGGEIEKMGGFTDGTLSPMALSALVHLRWHPLRWHPV